MTVENQTARQMEKPTESKRAADIVFYDESLLLRQEKSFERERAESIRANSCPALSTPPQHHSTTSWHKKKFILFSSYLLVLPRRKAQWSARSLLMSYNSRAGQQCIVFTAAEEAAASLLIYRPWHGMPHFTPRPDRISCRWPPS